MTDIIVKIFTEAIKGDIILTVVLALFVAFIIVVTRFLDVFN